MIKKTFPQHIESKINSDLKMGMTSGACVRCVFDVTYRGKAIRIPLLHSYPTKRDDGKIDCNVTLPFMVVCREVCNSPGEACSMFLDYNSRWRSPHSWGSPLSSSYSRMMLLSDGKLENNILAPLSQLFSTNKNDEKRYLAFETNVKSFFDEVGPQLEKLIVEDLEYADLDRLINAFNKKDRELKELTLKIQRLQSEREHLNRQLAAMIDSSLEDDKEKLAERVKRSRRQ